MSFYDIIATKHIGKATKARFKKSQKGILGIEVGFEFMQAGVKEHLSWTGWLSPVAIERTMDTLVNVLGFNGDDETVNGGELKPGSLNSDKEVELDVQMETYAGKTTPRIRFVNSLGNNFGAIPAETVRAELSSIGFKAAYLAAKQKANGVNAQAPQAVVQSDFANAEEIPF